MFPETQLPTACTTQIFQSAPQTPHQGTIARALLLNSKVQLRFHVHAPVTDAQIAEVLLEVILGHVKTAVIFLPSEPQCTLHVRMFIPLLALVAPVPLPFPLAAPGVAHIHQLVALLVEHIQHRIGMAPY